jgi:hypothetical protein
MIYKSFEEIETDLNNNLSLSGLNAEYNHVSIDKIKENTYRKIFYENNTFRVEYTEEPLNRDDITKISLKYDVDNINDFLTKCKDKVLKYSTKERKIKEVEQYLVLEKIFNDTKEKYFSLYDLQKKIKNKEISINDLINRLDNEKYLVFGKYYYPDSYQSYRNEEILLTIFEFFNLILFDKLPELKHIDNNPKNRYMPITEQDFLNVGIKIKLFNGHYYYYPTGKNDKVLLFVKEQLKRRLENEY